MQSSKTKVELNELFSFKICNLLLKIMQVVVLWQFIIAVLVCYEVSLTQPVKVVQQWT
jgi:hypothetical protein